MKKRILSFFLVLVLCLASFPMTAVADEYEDREECWWCGHYHWGDYKCDDCGGCSSSCDNSECYEVTHCTFCGQCLCYVDHCLDGGLPACMDCLQEEGYHCAECGECYCFDPEPLCGNCFCCPDCVEICDDCGWCFDCGEHCEICGACWPDMCQQGGDHCEECCENFGWLCPECGECSEGKGIETCEICGLCEECCEANACPDCGMCAEDIEFETHFCEECGDCLTGKVICEICGLCSDCCESLAQEMGCECGEYCWTEVEDEHICCDCGRCFGETDPCTTCFIAGEYRCEECCADQSAMAGCDCDTPVCINSSEWEDHLKNEHTAPNGEHDMVLKNTWEYDENGHWRSCRWCEEADHKTAKQDHVFNEQGRCTVCGYNSNEDLVITVQPRDIVTDVNDESENYDETTISFNVRAYGKDGYKGLKYQWYKEDTTARKLTDSDSVQGANEAKLTVVVPSDCCYETYRFYCVITDEYGNELTTRKAELKGRHVFKYLHLSASCSKCSATAEGHILGCAGSCCDEHSKRMPHTYSAWQWNYNEDHERTFRSRTCTECGYEERYYAHVHSFDFDEIAILTTLDETQVDITRDADYNVIKLEGTLTDSNTGKVVKAGMDEHYHWIECNVSGCDMIRYQEHEWTGWQYVTAETSPEAGGLYRECKDCGYTSNHLFEDKSGNPMKWEFGVHPIETVNCTAATWLAKNGDTVKITPDKLEGKTFDHYEAEMNVVKKVSDTSYEEDGSVDISLCINGNILTVPTTYLGKGTITVTAVYTDGCDHAHTEVINELDATCTKMGYSGDTVCSDCGMIITAGHDTDELGHATEVKATEAVYAYDKDGNVVYNSDGYPVYVVLPEITGITCGDTGKDYYSNYTGDTLCSRCGQIVTKGHYTSRIHELVPVEEVNDPTLRSEIQSLGLKGYTAPACTKEGYSGDMVCKGCGTGKIKYGKVLNPAHPGVETVGKVDPTCTSKGYTGDEYCTECHELVKKGKAVPKLEHVWNGGTTISKPECTVPGATEYECTLCHDTKTEIIPALGHDWSAWTSVSDTEHQRTCANDPKHVETEAHTFADNKCTGCGYVKGSKNYKMLEGDGSEWTVGSDETLKFRSEAELSIFAGVEIDGNAIDSSMYEVSEGSTIIVLKNAYLKTLKVGSHTIRILSKDGSAAAKFLVKAAPEPSPAPGGDPSPSPAPGGDPSPSPAPGGDPSPSPTPGGNPSPSPAPGGNPDGGNGGNGGNNGTSPKTGAVSNAGTWMLITAMSGAVVLATVRKKKNR